MNRETKRLLQRQGQIGADGQPTASQRPAPKSASSIANRPARRGSFLGYLRDVRTELRKVAWPTRAEVRNYSSVVFVTLIFMLALIFGLDVGFSKIATFLFK